MLRYHAPHAGGDMTHNVFVSLPSVRGVHPQTFWNVFDMRTELEKSGHSLSGGSVYRMPLDLARNELATVFLSTTCDLNLLLDDDVQIDPGGLLKMVTAIDGGCDIVSAPCRLRDHAHGGAQAEHAFNVRPIGRHSLMGDVGGVQTLVDECEMTGLGAVLVKRHVLEKLFGGSLKYASRLMPDRQSSAIFTSEVSDATALLAGAPADLRVYILDDVVFSMKALKLGFKIHAALGVGTTHDGMHGNFWEEAQRLQKAQAVASSRLVGADGRKLHGKF